MLLNAFLPSLKNITIGLFLFLNSCNLPLQHQKHLTRKFNRADISEKVFENGIDTIHYFEGGVGDTVLLIHGFGGDAQITWDKTILDLAKDFHVIAPDLLWFGESHSSRTPNLNAQVSALTALLDSRQISTYHLAGISYGGFVSLGLFYNQPERVESICIIDSPGITYDVRLLDTLCAAENVKSVDEIFVVKSPEQVLKLFNLGFYKDRKIPKSTLKKVYELYFNQHHAEQKELLSSLLGDQADFLNLKPIAFPKSLVIWGDKDDVFPLSEGKKLATFMGADFLEIPDAGHAANIEGYKLFEKFLRVFLGKSNG